jgi:hypothetical protein
MKAAARARPASSACARVKISSNWSKMSRGDDRLALGVAQFVFPVVQELPQRLALLGRAGARPGTGGARGPEHGLLDLVGGRQRGRAVIDADIDRAVALLAEPRHHARVEDRGLAEAGLAEEHRQQLALHAARELADLLFAAVELAAGLLGEGGEAEPGMLGIDRSVDRRRGAGIRGRHGQASPENRRRRRAAKASPPSPAGRRVKCAALNLSGTRAVTSTVSSMQTGRMKTAPSAMLRVRSIA